MKTGQERESFRARAATLEQQVIELKEAHEADLAYRQVRVDGDGKPYILDSESNP
jgi:hypothetical protein